MEIPVQNSAPAETKAFKLPLWYQDLSAMIAFFPAPTGKLKPLLPDRRLKLVPLIPGFSLVGIACIEYKECDLGPYNEVGIFFPVRYQPRLNLPLLPVVFEQSYPDLGAYIHRLPVTTQAAFEAGVRFWGYPKVIGDIEFEEASGWRICRWLEAGQLVLELAMQIPMPGPVGQRDLKTFSVLEGQLLTTVFSVEGSIRTMLSPNVALLTLGTHAYAEEVKAWGLRARAIGARVFTQMRGRLDAAQKSEPLEAPRRV